MRKATRALGSAMVKLRAKTDSTTSALLFTYTCATEVSRAAGWLGARVSHMKRGAHIALAHDISNVWKKLAESNLSQHSQQLDSDIAPGGVQTFCSQLSKHCFARRANVMHPRSFLLRAAAFLLETFQLNNGCSGFWGRFPSLNSAAGKCFGLRNALHAVIRQLR